MHTSNMGTVQLLGTKCSACNYLAASYTKSVSMRHVKGMNIGCRNSWPANASVVFQTCSDAVAMPSTNIHFDSSALLHTSVMMHNRYSTLRTPTYGMVKSSSLALNGHPLTFVIMTMRTKRSRMSTVNARECTRSFTRSIMMGSAYRQRRTSSVHQRKHATVFARHGDNDDRGDALYAHKR